MIRQGGIDEQRRLAIPADERLERWYHFVSDEYVYVPKRLRNQAFRYRPAFVERYINYVAGLEVRISVGGRDLEPYEYCILLQRAVALVPGSDDAATSRLNKTNVNVVDLGIGDEDSSMLIGRPKLLKDEKERIFESLTSFVWLKVSKPRHSSGLEPTPMVRHPRIEQGLLRAWRPFFSVAADWEGDSASPGPPDSGFGKSVSDVIQDGSKIVSELPYGDTELRRRRIEDVRLNAILTGLQVTMREENVGTRPTISSDVAIYGVQVVLRS